MTGVVCWGTDQQQAVFIWLGLWFGDIKCLSAQDKAFQHKSQLGARRPPRMEEKIKIIRRAKRDNNLARTQIGSAAFGTGI